MMFGIAAVDCCIFVLSMSSMSSSLLSVRVCGCDVGLRSRIGLLCLFCFFP